MTPECDAGAPVRARTAKGLPDRTLFTHPDRQRAGKKLHHISSQVSSHSEKQCFLQCVCMFIYMYIYIYISVCMHVYTYIIILVALPDVEVLLKSTQRSV